MAKVTIEWLEKKIASIEKTERFYGFITDDLQTELEAYRMLAARLVQELLVSRSPGKQK